MRMRDVGYGRNQRRVRRRWFARTFRRYTAEADFVAAAIPPPIIILVTAAAWASAIAVTFSATIVAPGRRRRPAASGAWRQRRWHPIRLVWPEYKHATD